MATCWNTLWSSDGNQFPDTGLVRSWVRQGRRILVLCVFSWFWNPRVWSPSPPDPVAGPRNTLPPSGCSAPVVVSAQTVTPGRKQAYLVKGLIREVPRRRQS